MTSLNIFSPYIMCCDLIGIAPAALCKGSAAGNEMPAASQSSKLHQLRSSLTKALYGTYGRRSSSLKSSAPLQAADLQVPVLYVLYFSHNGLQLRTQTRRAVHDACAAGEMSHAVGPLGLTLASLGCCATTSALVAGTLVLKDCVYVTCSSPEAEQLVIQHRRSPCLPTSTAEQDKTRQDKRLHLFQPAWLIRCLIHQNSQSVQTHTHSACNCRRKQQSIQALSCRRVLCLSADNL